MLLGLLQSFLLYIISLGAAAKFSAVYWCYKVFCYVLVLGLLQSFLLLGLLQSFLLCVGSRADASFCCVLVLGLLQSFLLCVGSRDTTKFSAVR